MDGCDLLLNSGFRFWLLELGHNGSQDELYRLTVVGVEWVIRPNPPLKGVEFWQWFESSFCFLW